MNNAKDREITKEDAVLLLNEAKTHDRLLELFKVASKIRGHEVGNVFRFDGCMGSIMPCTISPPCNYCRRSAKTCSPYYLNPLKPEKIALGADSLRKLV